MKLLCLFVFAFFVESNAGGYAQTIDLSVSHASLETVFKVIKKQTGYRFVYIKEELRLANSVSIHVKKASLKQVLDLCFADQPLHYLIEEQYIIVKPRTIRPENTIVTTGLFDVTGTVTDERGVPVAGVTVSIKGTNYATATNSEGIFTLSGVTEGAVLVFSGTNVEDYELKAGSDRHLQVRLQTKIGKLDEVQVIAYGTTTQRLNTGSVSKISARVLEGQPVLNPLAAIQGRAAGVFINTQNGMPGGNISIQIRGRGSINAGTDPLFVIDGVPFSNTALNSGSSVLTTSIVGSTSPLNSINPHDIESIEILKDADATGLYGSRGANGVVLITTKKGKEGKTRFDINLFSGMNQLAEFPDLLNLNDYLRLRREGFANDQIQPTVTNAPDLLLWDTTIGRDWPRYLLGRKAFLTNVQAGISGGTKLTHFLLSGHFRKEGTILPGDEQYERRGAHIALQHKSSDERFGMDVNLHYSSDANEFLSSSVFSIMTLPPHVPIYDANGNYNWNGIADMNPAAVSEQKAKSRTSNLISQLTIRYQVITGLSFSTNLGYTINRLDQVMTYPKVSINPATGSESYAYYGDQTNRVFLVEPQLNYQKKVKASSVQVLTGMTWQNNVREGSFITGRNYSSDALLEFSGAAGTVTASNQYSQYKYASLFTRLHYDYKEKYILNVNMRRDGSSRFGPRKQFGHFGAIGAAWNFSKEKVFTRQKILSYGKLRASFGVTGNDLIPDYQYLTSFGANGSMYQGVNGIAPSRIANADFGWENTNKLETAIEFGLVNNRILVTAAYYRNRSYNQLISYPLPYTSGSFGSYLANLPALVQNEGWELDVNAVAVRNSFMRWNLYGNISVPRNKLLKYPGLATSSFANTYVIGEDLNIRRALHFTGIHLQTGLPEYEDVDKDGRISLPNDYVIIGRTSPFYYGGFGNELTIQQFEFHIFFQFSKQFSQGTSTIAGTRSNKFSVAMTRWQKPGDDTQIAKATTIVSGAYSLLAQSDATFYNASYMRLKNISLSYRMPVSILRRIKVESCRIYAEAQNLYTWRKQANLFDPETGNTGIAPLKTIAAGIQITF